LWAAAERLKQGQNQGFPTKSTQKRHGRQKSIARGAAGRKRSARFVSKTGVTKKEGGANSAIEKGEAKETRVGWVKKARAVIHSEDPEGGVGWVRLATPKQRQGNPVVKTQGELDSSKAGRGGEEIQSNVMVGRPYSNQKCAKLRQVLGVVGSDKTGKELRKGGSPMGEKRMGKDDSIRERWFADLNAMVPPSG